MSVVLVKDVHKSYGETKVLSGVNLSINEGEQLVIQGPSGSGKSTLLYLLGGLDQGDTGVVKINNKELSHLSDDDLAKFRNVEVGFVFQFHFLLPSMNCLENIYLPAKISQRDDDELKSWVLDLAEKLGVTHCLKKYPFEISGGEQQRVNIIRALSLRPRLLLCDEPTGNLDSNNSQLVMKLLKDLSKEVNSTLIVVTHDVKIADSFDRKITIEDGHIIS